MVRWLRQCTPVVLIGALSIVAIAAACGDDETTNPTDDTAGDTIVVNLTADPYTFSPGEVTISTGDVVRWVDEEDNGVGHTVTPDGHSEWTSENMSDGDVFTHKFDSAGTFPYICIPHEGAGMVGTVIVQ